MPKCRGFKMASLNITSLLKHIDELRVFLNDQNIDVLAINETRLNESILDQEVKVQGYDIIHRDRSTNRPIIARFLRYADREMVLHQARKTLKNKEFSVFEDIPKELYKLRKSQSKKFKEARDRGDNVYFSKKFPDRLYVNGQFIPHHDNLFNLFNLFI